MAYSLDGKASTNSKEWVVRWIVVLAALVILFVLFCLSALPLIAGVYIASVNHDTINYFIALSTYGPTKLWDMALAYPGWQVPTLIVLVLFASIEVVLGTYAAKEAKQSTSPTNLTGPHPSSSHAKGSAGVYSNPELISELNETCTKDIPPVYGGLVLGCLAASKRRPERLVLAPEESHALIIGMTGSGKTQISNFPTIYAFANATRPCSAVILDTKGELYAGTSHYLRAKGHPVYVIDFRNTERSDSINPLQNVVDAFASKKEIYDKEMQEARDVAKRAGVVGAHIWQESAWAKKREDYLEFKSHVTRADAAKKSGWSRAEELTRDIALTIVPEDGGGSGGASAGAAHWLDVGRGLIEALILLVCTYTTDDFTGEGEPYPEPEPEQRTLPSVSFLLREFSGVEGTSGGPRKLIRLMDKIDANHPASKAFAQIRTSQDSEFATTVSEAIKFINKLIPSSVESFMSRNDIDFGSLGERRSFLFLIVPSDKPAAGRMFSLLFTQIHQALVERSAKYGNRLPVRVNFLLEEFASTCAAAPVKNLPDMLAVGRGYGLFLYMTVQTLSQLEEIYGKATLTTILDNCSTKVLIKTSDAQGTAAFFSRAIGKYTYCARNESTSREHFKLFDKSRTKTYREEERDYFTADEITRFPDNFGVLVLQTRPGKVPGRRAFKLGFDGTMKPLLVPTLNAYETFVGRAFHIDDLRVKAEFAASANKESKVEARTPLVPWDPRIKRADALETINEQLHGRGIALDTKQNVSKRVKRQAAQDMSRVHLLSMMAACGLDLDALRAAGIMEVEDIVDRLERRCANTQKKTLLDKNLGAEELSRARAEADATAAAMRYYWRRDLVELIKSESAPEWFLEEARRAGLSHAFASDDPRATTPEPNSPCALDSPLLLASVQDPLPAPLNFVLEETLAGEMSGSEPFASTSALPASVQVPLTEPASAPVLAHDSPRARSPYKKTNNTWINDMRADVSKAKRTACTYIEFESMLASDFNISLRRQKSGKYNYCRDSDVISAEKLGACFVPAALELDFARRREGAQESKENAAPAHTPAPKNKDDPAV